MVTKARSYTGDRKFRRPEPDPSSCSTAIFIALTFVNALVWSQVLIKVFGGV